ncbi:MAG: hypothetical protein DME26_06010, partial [Verrucomicrobia bacterium]
GIFRRKLIFFYDANSTTDEDFTDEGREGGSHPWDSITEPGRMRPPRNFISVNPIRAIRVIRGSSIE